MTSTTSTDLRLLAELVEALARRKSPYTHTAHVQRIIHVGSVKAARLICMGQDRALFGPWETASAGGFRRRPVLFEFDEAPLIAADLRAQAEGTAS